MVLNGFAVLALAYSGCSVTSAVFFLTLSLSLNGAVSTGALASIVDISPNYASITLGIVSTFSIMTGFVSPILVGFITYENQSVEAWQHIFVICAAILIVMGIIYILFSDSSLQDWNNPQQIGDSSEVLPLNSDKKNCTESMEQLKAWSVH